MSKIINKPKKSLKHKLFSEFDLDERLLKTIAEIGWKHPTQVQEGMIPLMLDGKNILARARTGSGKTAAFLLPIIQKVLQLAATSKNDNKSTSVGPSALIIAPTKELASQIFELVQKLTGSLVFLESINFAEFEDGLENASFDEMVDIAVSTPGRLLAILKNNPNLLDNVQFVVLDEADLLFSYGYKEEIRKIKTALPANFQTIMTSATLNEDMEELRTLFVVGPIVSLKLKEGNLPDVSQLAQYHIFCNNDEERFSILLSIIKLKLLLGKSVIFCSTTDRCYKLHLFFEAFKISSCILNSQMPANYRCRMIKEFNEGKYPYIIASECNDVFDEEIDGETTTTKAGGNDDEAKKAKKEKNKQKWQRQKKNRHFDKESGIGRGIDFHFVSNVINFDFPTSTDMYIHRVGRTARGWNKGTAISFVAQEERKIFEQIQKDINEQMGQDALQPYEVRMKDFESFQLRAREALSACTKTVIREARLEEIRQEILKSKQLKAYFEKNPREKQILEQNKKTHKLHLHSASIADVPDYIVPKALRGQNFAATTKNGAAKWQDKNRKRKHGTKLSAGGKRHKKQSADPLQTFHI